MKTTHNDTTVEELLSNWIDDLSYGDQETLIFTLEDNDCDLIPCFYDDLGELLEGMDEITVFNLARNVGGDFSTFDNYFYLDDAGRLLSCNDKVDAVSFFDIENWLLDCSDISSFEFDDDYTEEEQQDQFNDFMNDNYLK